MTKEEAIAHSRKTGDKIKHYYFSDNEFIIVRGNQVEVTEGYKIWLNDFFIYRTDESWDIDWSIVHDPITII